MHVFSIIARFSVRIFTFYLLMVRRFSRNMLFVPFIGVVCEERDWIWKLTPISYDKVVGALSLVSLGMSLAILELHSIAGFTNVTFLLSYFRCLLEGADDSRVKKTSYFQCKKIVRMSLPALL